MPLRDYQINGETLVKVKFGAHIKAGQTPPNIYVSGISDVSSFFELGLAVDDVRIVPTLYHRDLKLDDMGLEAAAEVLWMASEVNISMKLLHYNRRMLDVCLAESMGGAPPISGGFAGIFNPVGGSLGRGLAIGASGCHYISLDILSENLNFPWRFPASYLYQRPIEIPLSTKTSMVMCNWRSIPYVPLTAVQNGSPNSFFSGSTAPTSPLFTTSEQLSSGQVLWNHILDSNN